MNLELAQQNKVRTLEPETLELAVKAVLVRIYTRLKQIPDSSQFKFEVSDLSNELRRCYKHLTLNQIEKFLVSGLTSEYNQPCIANYLKWIKSGDEENKTTAISEHDQVRARLAQKTELTDHEKEEIAKNAFEACLRHYKQTGVVLDYGSGVYSYLERKGAIKLSNDEKQVILDEATRIVNSELNEQLVRAKDEINRAEVSRINNEIGLLIDNPPKARAKLIALENYLKTLL